MWVTYYLKKIEEFSGFWLRWCHELVSTVRIGQDDQKPSRDTERIKPDYFLDLHPTCDRVLSNEIHSQSPWNV
jgi:hypothetical protein